MIDFPKYIDTTRMGESIMCYMGYRLEFITSGVFMSLKIVFILANSADPYVAFHMDVHCLPMYPFTGIQNEKY